MRKIHEVIQEEVSDCAICSLACIIHYYGGYIPLEILRLDTSTDNNGTNAYEVINCAKKYGFNAYGKKEDRLDNILYPVIVHLNIKDSLYHFVVVYKITDKYIYMMDPSIGIKKMNVDEFYKLYTGVVLYFEPISTIPRFDKSDYIYNKIKLDYKCNKNKYLLLLILSGFILLFSLIINFQIKLLSVNINYIYFLILLIIINELIIYFKSNYAFSLTKNLNNKILKYFISHLFKLPLKYLKLKRKGEISTRFNELNELSNSLINIAIEIIFNVFLISFIFVIICVFNLTIASMLVFVSLIFLYLNIKIYSKLINDIRYSINLEEEYHSKIIEYISGVETIKNLSKYKYFKNNIFDNLKLKNNVRYNLNKKFSKINLINNILINVLLLMILYLIVKNNYSSINSLTLFIFVNYFINIIKVIVNYFPSVLFIKSYIIKNNDFLSLKYDVKPLVNTKFNNIRLINLSYSIHFHKILDNINFTIKNKDKIFISGPSGIGKSTLMKIINQEISDYDGKIFKDNVDIKDYSLSNLISYVSQNEMLFDDSIYNNITLKEEVSNDKLKDILNICRLNNLVDNKISKLESIVINNSNISGGERNRIILARGLIHSKKIIILDEVLKEVDINLEIDILRDLLMYFKNNTIIYISHKNVGFLFNKILTLGKE